MTAIRECVRCAYVKPNKKRCKLTACATTKYCWIHLKMLYGLRVKESQIPNAGKGLFTEKVIKPHVNVGRYEGDVLTPEEVEARYPGNKNRDYVLQITAGQLKGKYVDARSTQSSIVRYINDPKGSKFQANTRFTPAGYVQTTKAIPKGKELFVHYGNDYWKKR